MMTCHIQTVLEMTTGFSYATILNLCFGFTMQLLTSLWPLFRPDNLIPIYKIAHNLINI